MAGILLSDGSKGLLFTYKAASFHDMTMTLRKKRYLPWVC